MIDPAAVTSLLFEHMIAAAERSRPNASEMRVMTAAEILMLEAHLIDLYDQRRLALEEMMLAPFRSLRDHA